MVVFKKENKIISKNSKVLIETNSNAFIILFESKNSCTFTTFKKEISYLSHIAKKLLAQQFLHESKNMFFLANFMRKIQTILSLNSTFLSLSEKSTWL